MTRSRASAKQAGTRWESALDKGDITGIPGVVIEAKDVAKISLAEFLREAQVEAENAGALVGAAWIKRRGKASPADAYVVMDGETFTHLLKEAGY